MLHISLYVQGMNLACLFKYIVQVILVENASKSLCLCVFSESMGHLLRFLRDTLRLLKMLPRVVQSFQIVLELCIPNLWQRSVRIRRLPGGRIFPSLCLSAKWGKALNQIKQQGECLFQSNILFWAGQEITVVASAHISISFPCCFWHYPFQIQRSFSLEACYSLSHSTWAIVCVFGGGGDIEVDF